MTSRFDKLDINETKDKPTTDLSLEDVLRFMIDNNYEFIQIKGYNQRWDKTKGVAYSVRHFKNGIPTKE